MKAYVPWSLVLLICYCSINHLVNHNMWHFAVTYNGCAYL